MRDLHPDFKTAIQSSEVTPALLVFLDFAETPVRAWTGIGHLDYGGHGWQGYGMLASVDAVEEYSDVRAGQVTLSLTQIPNHTLTEVPELVFKRRKAEISLALFVGDSMTLIGVELLMRGTMDTLKLLRGATSSTLKLTVTNELARLRESWGMLYTDAHQQQLFPGDTSMRFTQSMQDLTIRF
jgi:hypothetical protein